MKKFSNIDKKEEVLKVEKPKMNRLVDYLIRENLQVTYNGDLDEIINKELSIEGSSELVEKLSELIKKYNDETNETLKESLKYKFGSQFDQKTINKEIKLLEDTLYVDVVPSPYDIFSSEDYNPIHEDTIVLQSLNNMPSDYMDFVKYENAKKYFENGEIKLRYAGPGVGWELYFENKGEYGTPIDSESDKYKKFITENKDFVADFLRATNNLIGSQNLLLDKVLVSQF